MSILYLVIWLHMKYDDHFCLTRQKFLSFVYVLLWPGSCQNSRMESYLVLGAIHLWNIVHLKSCSAFSRLLKSLICRTNCETFYNSIIRLKLRHRAALKQSSPDPRGCQVYFVFLIVGRSFIIIPSKGRFLTAGTFKHRSEFWLKITASCLFVKSFVWCSIKFLPSLAETSLVRAQERMQMFEAPPAQNPHRLRTTERQNHF